MDALWSNEDFKDVLTSALWEAEDGFGADLSGARDMVNYQLNGYWDVAPVIDHVMRGARRDASDEEQFVLDAIHEGMLNYNDD